MVNVERFGDIACRCRVSSLRSLCNHSANSFRNWSIARKSILHIEVSRTKVPELCSGRFFQWRILIINSKTFMGLNRICDFIAVKLQKVVNFLQKLHSSSRRFIISVNFNDFIMSTSANSPLSHDTTPAHITGICNLKAIYLVRQSAFFDNSYIELMDVLARPWSMKGDICYYSLNGLSIHSGFT